MLGWFREFSLALSISAGGSGYLSFFEANPDRVTVVQDASFCAVSRARKLGHVSVWGAKFPVLTKGKKGQVLGLG